MFALLLALALVSVFVVLPVLVCMRAFVSGSEMPNNNCQLNSMGEPLSSLYVAFKTLPQPQKQNSFATMRTPGQNCLFPKRTWGIARVLWLLWDYMLTETHFSMSHGQNSECGMVMVSFVETCTMAVQPIPAPCPFLSKGVLTNPSP